MLNEPQIIFLIDDNVGNMYAEMAQTVFPNAEIFSFRDEESAIEEIENGRIPSLMFMDATRRGYRMGEWGAYAAKQIIDHLANSNPDASIPNIVFQSADENLANVSKRLLLDMLARDKYELEIVATDKEELALIKDLIEETPPTRVSGDPGNELRKFMNRAYGMNFLLTQKEIDQHFAAHENADPELLLRLAENGTLSKNEVLARLVDGLEQEIDRAYTPRVETSDSFRAHALLSISFVRGSGLPVSGPVAFSYEEAQAFAEKGQKPIYIVNDAGFDIVQSFKYAAAVVVLSSKISGHLELLGQAHRIPMLIAKGRQPNVIGTSKRVHLSSRSGKAALSITVSANLFDEDFAPDKLLAFGVDEIRKFPNGHKLNDEDKKPSHRIKMRVRSGDFVTVSPWDHHLFTSKLDISRTYESYTSWRSEAEHLLENWGG